MGPGELIAGRFEVAGVAGTGGMGTVYRTLDRETGSPAAVKLMHSLDDGDLAARFMRETRVLAALSHPAIVRHVAHGVTGDGCPYLAMEWLEGETLGARLRGGALSIAESISLALGVCDALAAAHRAGVIHRDLKPDNLFLVDGQIGQLKLLDFGVARLAEGTTLTRTGMTVGTPLYMAPEQARGLEGIDRRVDIYSLGAVLFCCVTGRPPFRGEHPAAVLAKILFDDVPQIRELRAEAPDFLDQLVSRMLAKDPDERPADTSAVVDGLRAGEGPANRAAESPLRAAVTPAEQRHLCVLFASRGPNEETLHQGAPQPDWSAAADIAARHDAAFESLADGSLVAVFAAREGSATEAAVRAARCALALRGSMPELWMVLATGRGQIRGRVPAGEVIDTAASMLHVLAGSQAEVVVDDVTSGLLDARFVLQPRSSEADAPSTLRTLLGERELPVGARRVLGKATPFVGRVRELAALEATLDTCIEDECCHAVLVAAPAGAGKSRLRHEFLQAVADRDEPITVLSAYGDVMRAGAPFDLLSQVIRDGLGLRPGPNTRERRDQLRQRVASRVEPADAERVSQFLAELAGVPFPGDSSVELRAARRAPDLLSYQLRLAWENWLAAEVAHAPVLLVLEDVHWADGATVDFVDSAMRALRDRPLMVLALARPEVHEVFPKLWAGRGLDEISLRGLPRKGCVRLVRHLLGDSLPEPILEEILQRAEGNAFFLEELVRAFVANPTSPLPPSVLATVEARLSVLPDRLRQLLRAASIFGHSFTAGGVHALLGGPDASGSADPDLDALVEHELVSRTQAAHDDEGEYTFQHALVREAAYAGITEVDRVRAHLAAAEWLEQRGAADAEVLAHHFETGGNPARAASWYFQAARQALAGDDFAAAMERGERAIACGATGDARAAVRVLQAQASLWSGESTTGERCAREATELYPRTSSGWADAVHYLSWASADLGKAAPVQAIADQLLSIPREHLGPLHVIAMARVATHQLVGTDLRRMKLLVDAAEALAARVDDPIATATVTHASALWCSAKGDRGTAVDLALRAAELWDAAGDRRNARLDRGNAADSMMELGRYQEAEALLREVTSSEQVRLSPFFLALANLGLAVAYDGRLDEAHSLIDRAIEGMTGAPYYESLCRIYRARVRLMQEDLEGAVAAATKAASIPGAPEIRIAYALAVRAEAWRLSGNTAESLRDAEESARVAEVTHLENGHAFTRLAYAEALAAAGELDRARSVIADARDRLLAQADALTAPEDRDRYLAAVPDHARTMARASDWLEDG